MPETRDFVDLLARDYGRELTRRVAEEELPYYDEIVALNGSGETDPDDHTLGFGAQELGVTIVSTVLFEIGKQILSFLWEHGKDATGQLIRDLSREGVQFATQRFREWLAQHQATSPILLSQTDKEKLIALVSSQASENNLSEDEKLRLLSTIDKAFAKS